MLIQLQQILEQILSYTSSAMMHHVDGAGNKTIDGGAGTDSLDD